MLSFTCDYAEGAHPLILKALTDSNLEQLPGYGSDVYCQRAKEKIRQACACPDADIHFLVGGTQTNATVIASLLRNYEGVVAAKTGHIGVHEAGAVEYTGHKVLCLPSHQGKLEAGELEALLRRFYDDPNHEHMPFPGMVYLSHPTELGTLYTKRELEDISAVCRRWELPLFLDGARLGYGLMSPESDLTLPDIAALCDLFTVGGTKMGALCGEALVFSGLRPPRGFLTMTKQQGAMLAKGRLLGVQFDALFTDGLYWALARHAIEQAMALKAAFLEKGYPLFADSPTNQQFVILTGEQFARLEKEAAFSLWEPLPDGRLAVRFVTSWATRPEDVEALAQLL